MSALATIQTTPLATGQARESAAMFSMVERIMADPQLPIERVNQAFDFYKRVQDEQARKEWAAAFVAAQQEMEPIKKDANNTQTKSRYASFEALDRALRPIYTKNGFAPTFDTEDSDKPDHIRVVMDLIHIGGHSRRYHVDMPADGKGAKGGDVMTKTHAAGSAFTYGKRYVFGNAFNIATTDNDDDGNAAGNELICSEQIAELQQLIDDTGVDKAKFLEIGKVESLSDITTADFGKAKALLLSKKKKDVSK